MPVNYEKFFKEMKDYGMILFFLHILICLQDLKTKNIYDIWNDKILNLSLSIDASK